MSYVVPVFKVEIKLLIAQVKSLIFGASFEYYLYHFWPIQNMTIFSPTHVSKYPTQISEIFYSETWVGYLVIWAPYSDVWVCIYSILTILRDTSHPGIDLHEAMHDSYMTSHPGIDLHEDSLIERSEEEDRFLQKQWGEILVGPENVPFPLWWKCLWMFISQCFGC